MSMYDIVNEIKTLPVYTKIRLVEEVLKSIRQDELNHSMQVAVDMMYDDYKKDKELTIFSSLDWQDFYETK